MTSTNIIKVYEKATQDEIDHGKRWYYIAEKFAVDIAYRHDIPMHTVAGVIAALSPNLKWNRNVADAETVVDAFMSGRERSDVVVSAYPQNVGKAWAILEQLPDVDGVKRILNGPKITAFFANIIGEDACTVDGHAHNIYYNKRLALKDKRLSIGKKEYAKIERAYRKAARKLGLRASELQAITWVAWRRIHNIN